MIWRVVVTFGWTCAALTSGYALAHIFGILIRAEFIVLCAVVAIGLMDMLHKIWDKNEE